MVNRVSKHSKQNNQATNNQTKPRKRNQTSKLTRAWNQKYKSNQKQSQCNKTIQHIQAKPTNHPNHQNKTAKLNQSSKK